MTYYFSYLEPVFCSMSSSNCCFLTCIQVSQEAGQVVWYSYLLKNFPQFIVIHTVKGFGIVNIAEIDVFLELSCFFDDPEDVGNLISGSSAFSKTSLVCLRKMKVLFTKSCLFAESDSLLSLTLCYPMDCNPPDSSVHGVFQAGTLEWVAISSSGESSQLRD